jgi:hypothetical protein
MLRGTTERRIRARSYIDEKIGKLRASGLTGTQRIYLSEVVQRAIHLAKWLTQP